MHIVIVDSQCHIHRKWFLDAYELYTSYKLTCQIQVWRLKNGKRNHLVFCRKEDPKEQQYSRSYLSNMSNLNELLFILGSECYCSWNWKDQTPHAKIKQATTWCKYNLDYESLIDVDAQERTSTSVLVIKMRRNGCSERDLEEISPILYEHFFPLLILLCV